MDLSKFTERARGVIQNAQTLATVQDHQRFMPVHLLKALMDDPEGLTRNLFSLDSKGALRLSPLLSRLNSENYQKFRASRGS